MANQKISARTVLTGAGLISTPVARAGNTTNYRRVDNLEATTDPGVGDDGADGFHIGSQWLNKSTGVEWYCIDATNGAAVWIKRPLRHGEGQLPFCTSTGVSGYLTNPIVSYTTAAMTANVIRLVPIVVPYRRAFTKIAFELTTVQASSHVRVALYNADPANGYKPTTIISGTDGGAFDTSVTTGKRETTFSSVTLDPGVYWAGFNTDSTPTLRVVSTGPFLAYDFGNNNLRCLNDSVTYGAMPSDLSAQTLGLSGLQAPILGIR